MNTALKVLAGLAAGAVAGVVGRKLAEDGPPQRVAVYTDVFSSDSWSPENIVMAFKFVLDDLIQYSATEGHGLDLSTLHVHCTEQDDDVVIQVGATVL